jgi:hypothetical protein
VLWIISEISLWNKINFEESNSKKKSARLGEVASAIYQAKKNRTVANFNSSITWNYRLPCARCKKNGSEIKRSFNGLCGIRMEGTFKRKCFLLESFLWKIIRLIYATITPKLDSTILIKLICPLYLLLFKLCLVAGRRLCVWKLRVKILFDCFFFLVKINRNSLSVEKRSEK